MNHHLAAALDAAVRGWHVFPLLPGRKRPAFEGWEDAATTDPGRIERWWTRHGHDRHGVGIACGPSGLLVIDCDQPKPKDPPSPGAGICDGADALAALAEEVEELLPLDTHTVATAGGGLHLYFQAPVDRQLGNSQRDLGWQIDTRGRGGLVVAAGTCHRGRVYRTVHDAPPAPLPGWIARRLAKPAHTPVDVPDVPTDRLSAYLAAAVDAVVRRVSDAPPGTHNRELYLGALNLGRLVAGGSLPHDLAYDALRSAELAIRARCDNPRHTDRQAHNTILSGFKAGADRPRIVGRAA